MEKYNIQFDIFEYTLKNGLKLLNMYVPESQGVTLSVNYLVGSSYEYDGIRGISHFLEHMMFRGTKNVAPEAHAIMIQNKGGSTNAGTSDDITSFYNTLPYNSIEIAFELEADRMRNLLLTPESLERERKVILEEVLLYENDPVMRAMIEFRKAAYQNHPYAFSPLGKKEDIESMTVDQIKDYYDKYYQPNNCILISVGNIKHSKAVDLTERYFSAIPSGNTIHIPEMPSISNKVDVFETSVPVEIPITALVFHIPPGKSEDIPVIEIIGDILTEGESSRIYQRIVRKEKLGVVAGGSCMPLRDRGLFAIYTAHLPGINPRRIIECIEEEILYIVEGKITDKDIEKAKRQLISGFIFDQYSIEARAGSITNAYIIEGDINRYIKRPEIYKNITKDTIREVAERLFSKKNQIQVIIKPVKVPLLMYLLSWIRRIRNRIR